MTVLTLAPLGWGALSVPRKKRGLPPVAAAAIACRCSSRFRMGRQKACGRSPPCARRSLARSAYARIDTLACTGGIPQGKRVFILASMYHIGCPGNSRWST